jgi:Zn finger protein HypA/HybF involved in hydrogenase expression
MRKKICLFFLCSIVILSNIVFAGALVEFHCDKCGFKSSSVSEGCGLMGVEYTVVYCKICKDFYAIPTEIAFETERNKSVIPVKPIGKKEFLGTERLIYPCPKCSSEVFVYNGPICPICTKGRLRKNTVGLWD